MNIAKCKCSERKDTAYHQCLLCDGGLCQECCSGDLEDSSQHIKCPKKRKHHSNLDDKTEDADDHDGRDGVKEKDTEIGETNENESEEIDDLRVQDGDKVKENDDKIDPDREGSDDYNILPRRSPRKPVDVSRESSIRQSVKRDTAKKAISVSENLPRRSPRKLTENMSKKTGTTENPIDVDATESQHQNLETSSTRSVPIELKTAKGRGADAGPFPHWDQSIPYSNSASYSAHNRVLHQVVDTCSNYYARVLQSQEKEPNTDLEVAFEFKCRIVHENGTVAFHKFEIGNTAHLSNPAQLYKPINAKKSIQQVIQNTNVKIQDQDVADIPLKEKHNKTNKTNVKSKPVKSKPVQELKKSSLAKSAIKTAKELFTKKDEDVSSSEEEDSPKQDNQTPAKTPAKSKHQTPPFVSVTPSDHLRAPFNKTSGKSQHLKNKPDNKIKKMNKKILDVDATTPSTSSNNPRRRKLSVSAPEKLAAAELRQAEMTSQPPKVPSPKIGRSGTRAGPEKGREDAGSSGAVEADESDQEGVVTEDGEAVKSRGTGRKTLGLGRIGGTDKPRSKKLSLPERLAAAVLEEEESTSQAPKVPSPKSGSSGSGDRGRGKPRGRGGRGRGRGKQ